MIRPQSVSTWMLASQTKDCGCSCPKCSEPREVRAYIIALEAAIDGAVRELSNLYPNNETVCKWLRGEK